MLYLKSKILILEKFKLRLKIIAKYNRKQIEDLYKSHKESFSQHLRSMTERIIGAEVTDRNIASSNFAIEQFFVVLSHEKIDIEIIKKFKSAISSGVQESSSLMQTYYSIVGMVYSRYKRFPRNILFFKSNFAKFQTIEW